MPGPVTRLNTALSGRYRVERELGEGGMATVYLAEDLKHERSVAIKILRPELAAVIGAERFVAEIKTTARLQHPHILPLFDSGEADGFLFYVMPYIEGENLRDRIEREGQLGVEDAVRIAREVADALDYAHRNEIVHRDIKPANVLLHDGRPMVADFGIALAVSAAGGGRMTETGLSLGTPHYMSPEQASADRDLTARSDVYSLGCVLYEMLAGQPPHTGPSAQSILVRILTEDPRDVSELRRTVPPNVAATVMKAIEKLPADRFESAKEFRAALEDPGFRYAPAAPRATAPPTGRGGPSDSAGPWLSDTRSRVAVGVIALSAVALVLQILGPGARTPDRAGNPPVHTVLDLGDPSTSNPQYYPVAISPDGSRFAVIRDGEAGMGQIYHRTAQDMEFRPVPGAEGRIVNLAFSPDGEWLVYSGASGLMRVSLLGGQPTQLFAAEDNGLRILDWGVDGWVAFWETDFGDSSAGIYRIPDTGGPVERLLGTPEWTPDGRPAQLPDGSGVLFQDRDRGIVLYEFESDSARVLIPSGIDPTYVHSGHVVYAEAGGGLWAAPFDLAVNELTGDPKPVLQGVVTSVRVGGYSVSRNGTLVYTAGPPRDGATERRIVVTGTDGTSSVLDLPPRVAFTLRWAPDGRRIAYAGGEPGEDAERLDIYIYDTESQSAPTRLTNRGHNTRPVFSPDGSRVVFASIREGTEDFDLFVRNLNDDAPPALLISLPGQQSPTDWPADSLIVMESGSAIQTVTLNGDTATYYAPDADVDGLRVAPNGRLAAYHSGESGEDEVYIRAFPDPRIETIVSEHPGLARWPWWSDDGRTLYYWAADTIWAAGIEADPAPRVVSRRPLFADSVWFFHDFRNGRFLGTEVMEGGSASGEEGEPIRHVVIHHWFTELERIFEGGR